MNKPLVTADIHPHVVPVGRRCLNCERMVPTFKADYAYADGTHRVRKGARTGSAIMRGLDPTGIFCTLICAARYGVRAAKERGTT